MEKVIAVLTKRINDYKQELSELEVDAQQSMSHKEYEQWEKKVYLRECYVEAYEETIELIEDEIKNAK